jgi:hypothetical protein
MIITTLLLPLGHIPFKTSKGCQQESHSSSLGTTREIGESEHGELAGRYSEQASSLIPARPLQPVGDLQNLAAEVSKILQFSLLY